jgi:Predicted periplasmic ligand-binding sensor domain
MADAQETSEKSSVDINRRAFKTLGISDGLRSNSVTSLLADSRGYLWIGTTQGLNRYDGHEVKTRFPESSDQQLREVFNNTVTSLEEDAEGRIWIECESGAYYIYDTKTAQFSASANQLLKSVGIRCDDRYKVKVGEKGTLWVLTKNNIFRYDCHRKNLKTWETRLQVPGTTADVVVEMSDGLYISVGHAVWHFLSTTGELQREPCLRSCGIR